MALLLAVLEIVVLAAAPAWHEHAHDHAGDHDEEQCAVTLFATGSWRDVSVTPVVVPQLEILPGEVVVERQQIAASFRYRGILEHAPPRRA